MQDQERPINPEDVSMQPPNIENLKQSSEGTPSPSLGPPHQDVPGGSTVDVDYFEAVSAEVAAAATRALDSWSSPLPLLDRQSAVSTTAKAAAFPLAAGAADVVAAIGEPADAAESAPSHIITEDSTAEEDASEGEWWW